MDQTKFVEDSLYKILSSMVCLCLIYSACSDIYNFEDQYHRKKLFILFNKISLYSKVWFAGHGVSWPVWLNGLVSVDKLSGCRVAVLIPLAVT